VDHLDEPFPNVNSDVSPRAVGIHAELVRLSTDHYSTQFSLRANSLPCGVIKGAKKCSQLK
jgi:hypothetical protein